MTDEQIIKALEEMVEYPHYYEEGQKLKSVLDLINRQNVEIEMLKHDRKKLKREFLTVRYETKAEAIKEFIQEHREIMMDFRDDDDQISLKVCEYDANTNNLAKEITGR